MKQELFTVHDMANYFEFIVSYRASNVIIKVMEKNDILKTAIEKLKILEPDLPSRESLTTSVFQDTTKLFITIDDDENIPDGGLIRLNRKFDDSRVTPTKKR